MTKSSQQAGTLADRKGELVFLASRAGRDIRCHSKELAVGFVSAAGRFERRYYQESTMMQGLLPTQEKHSDSEVDVEDV